MHIACNVDLKLKKKALVGLLWAQIIGLCMWSYRFITHDNFHSWDEVLKYYFNCYAFISSMWLEMMSSCERQNGQNGGVGVNISAVKAGDTFDAELDAILIQLEVILIAIF